MKQTPQTGLCFRQEPPLTESVGWRNVSPSSPPAAKPSQTQSPPWSPLIIAVGFVAAALIVANGNKPSPPAEPNRSSPSERLATVQSEPPVLRAQPVIWPRAEAAGPTTLFSPEWYANPSNRERWVCQEIPHQGRVWIHYQGQLQNADQLPKHPNLWDEYCTPGASWVWMIPVGATMPQWVDP